MSSSKTMIMTFALLLVLFSSGCMSMDVPPAHRGQLLDRTGAFAFYSGGEGFVGSVLGPGTYWTGIYDEIRVVD